MTEAWISVAKAAEIWELSPESVRRAARGGAVGSKRVGARGWLSVKAADVEALIVTKSRADRADAADRVAGTEDLKKTA